MYIDYQGVNVCQEEACVVADVDFHVDQSEFIYIIGPVGSGKSSLLKTIYCELDVLEARKAEVLGRDLLKLRRRDIPALRRELGVIFQDFQLLHDRTVERNLEFVLRATGWKDRKAIAARIAEVLQMVGMETMGGKMPSELSGGEQQRVAIARAILNNPKVIIADEPTGNLDPETADHIVALLKQVSMTGTAVVMSTHNLPMLDRYPGIVYECRDGRLAEVTARFNRMEPADF